MSKRIGFLPAALLVVCLSVVTLEAQQTGFIYQGKLMDSGSAANGNYDLQFALFDSSTGGSQIGQTQTVSNVLALAGVFTVTLDFGPAAFSGGARFLEISTRPTGTGAFSLLTPRQGITSTPYAVRSLSSATADTATLATNAQQLGGAEASQYVLTGDARLSDSRTPTAGSSNYIQNSANPQAAANFNISGSGTAGGTLSGNIVNANSQINLNGNRALAVTGSGQFPTSNTFTGIGAGTSTAPQNSGWGNFNAFFGFNAGTANTSGSDNSFFGSNAGVVNTTGNFNSFFGDGSGLRNTTGYYNSFFGGSSGNKNTTGHENAFFGIGTGGANTTGAVNSFFGSQAGSRTDTGNGNSFFGYAAGGVNIDGSFNSYFGRESGIGISASYNTALGAFANGANGITNATAIGARATVTASNSLVLGSINGVNGATDDTRVGIGLTAPSSRLHVVDPSNNGLRVQTNTAGGTVASFGGFGAFLVDGIGFPGGRLNIQENGNVGFGTNGAPVFRLQVADPGNTGLRVQTNTAGGTVASFGGLGDFQIDSPGFGGGRFIVKEAGNTGIGTTNPLAKLDVNGKLRVQSLGAGGSIQLCLNSSAEISNCSSSLRYKTALRPFTDGLNLVNRLHPLTFKWKADQTPDLGLGAEDVAAVEPLLVTRNANGEVEGVKYDRITVLLINAVKEQQAQIERQQAEIQQLKKLVCSSRRRAGGCR